MDNIFLYVTHLDGQQHGQAGLCIGHAGAEVGLAPVQPLVAEEQAQLGAGPPPQVHPLPWCAVCNVEHCNIGPCTETKEAENGISAFSISTFLCYYFVCYHTFFFTENFAPRILTFCFSNLLSSSTGFATG